MTSFSTDAGDDSGTVTTETALVLLVLLFFLLLSPAIWKIWIHENAARADAHRGAFYKSVFPLAVGNIEIPWWLSGHRQPEFPVEPTLEPLPPEDLRGYQQFPNEYVEGWKRYEVQYSSGWEGFRGQLEVSRYGAVIRSPWTWMGWQAVPTQDLISEPRKIRAWYKTAYQATLDDETVEGLKLSKKPL